MTFSIKNLQSILFSPKMFFSTKINPGGASIHKINKLASHNGPLVSLVIENWRMERKIKAHFLGPSQIGEKEKLHYSYNFILSAEIYFLYFDTVYAVKIGILKSQIKVIHSAK